MPPSAALEEYAAERADFERLLGAIRRLRDAPLADLRSLDWLAALIREVGLVPIPDFAATYADEAEFVNASQQGLIQLPREFARYLIFLSEHHIESYLEIGCFNGASVSLATAYLQRFHPALQATAIDLWPGFVFHPLVREILPLRYEVPRTSFDFRSQRFDAVFIDGDHSFEWAWADFQNVGRNARVCAFHDVNNAPYRELRMGGVPAVWELLQSTEPTETATFVEVREHPRGDAVMGIGIRLGPGAETGLLNAAADRRGCCN